MSASATQEMPPKGGYAPINFKRVPAKVVFKARHWLSLLFVTKAVTLYNYRNELFRRRSGEIENRSAQLSIMPLVKAERDRLLLRQAIMNKEEEEKVMANVPGWEVGTLYGEPVFKTRKNTDWIEPCFAEHYLHSSYSHITEYVDITFWVP